MHEQHEGPRPASSTAVTSTALELVRVEDGHSRRAPLRSFALVATVLVLVVAAGGYYRWSQPGHDTPAWALRTTRPNANRTPSAKPTDHRPVLGTPFELLDLAEPAPMATSDEAAYIAGFVAERGATASRGRCGSPSLWRVERTDRILAYGLGLGSVRVLAAGSGGRLIAFGRDIECDAEVLSLGTFAAGDWSFLTVSDGLPRTPAWLAIPPTATFQSALPPGILTWSPGEGAGTTYLSDSRGLWNGTANARPIGWDAERALWSLAHGGLDAAARPDVPSRLPIDVPGMEVATTAREPGVVFRNAAFVTFGSNVRRVPLDRSGPPEPVLGYADSRFAANTAVIAVVGGDAPSRTPAIAVSFDGIRFATRFLPSRIAVDVSSIIAVALTADAVLVEADDPTGGGIVVWAIPLLP